MARQLGGGEWHGLGLAVARAGPHLAPRGHLHTSDFRAERVQKARVEFAEHGLGDLVTASHSDVCMPLLNPLNPNGK